MRLNHESGDCDLAVFAFEHNNQTSLVIRGHPPPALSRGLGAAGLRVTSSHATDNGDDLGPWCCPNDDVYVKTYTIVLVGNLFTPSPDIYIYGGKKNYLEESCLCIIEVMLSEVCGYLCSLRVKSGLPPGRNSTWRCWWSMCYAKKNKNVAFCEDVSENTYTPQHNAPGPLFHGVPADLEYFLLGLVTLRQCDGRHPVSCRFVWVVLKCCFAKCANDSLSL